LDKVASEIGAAPGNNILPVLFFETRYFSGKVVRYPGIFPVGFEIAFCKYDMLRFIGQ